MTDWEKRCRELEALVAALQAQVAALMAENAALKERLSRTSANSSRPPSSDPPHGKPAPPRRPSGKAQGGQPGHARAERPLVPPERIDQAFDHRPAACAGCGHALPADLADPAPRRHQVAELPPLRPTVVEHRLHTLGCPRCGRATAAALPADVPRGRFGDRLAAVLATLAGSYRIGKRGVARLAADLLGLALSPGTVCKLERRTAAALGPTVAELAAAVRQGPVNLDETGWRQGGQGGQGGQAGKGGRRSWLWVAVGQAATVFRIAGSRAAAEGQALLGADYGQAAGQVATIDRYSGHLWLPDPQLCWAHLRRDFQAMVDRGGDGAAVGSRLLKLSDRLFAGWRRVRDGTAGGPAEAGQEAFRQEVERRGGLRSQVAATLRAGAWCDTRRTAATCRELLRDEEHLWTFLAAAGVEPTNNAAERALRHGVLWRKCSGGTKSAVGSRFVERMLSVVETCRRQGRDVIGTLAACLEAHRLGRPHVSLLNAQQ